MTDCAGRWRVALIFCVAALTMVITSVAVHAQSANAMVTGRLLDPDNIQVENAITDVILKSTADGKSYSTKSSAMGDFSLGEVPAGTYDLDVPIPCCLYLRYEQKGVVVAAGEALKLDVRLSWGRNLGTFADDPGALSIDMRARTKHPDAKPPRTARGRPDFSGVWYPIIGAYPRTPMPLQPWADAMQKKLTDEIKASGNDNSAGAYCLPQAATPSALPFAFRFVEDKSMLVQISEFTSPGFRQIFMDGRRHPDPNSWNPAWYGHSVGHWEGDTLVIDSVGFNEITPGFGIHTEKLHLIERIRRPTYGRLEIEITAEDPGAFTGPGVVKFAAGLAEGEDIQEYVCAENNKDLLHFGAWKGRPSAP